MGYGCGVAVSCGVGHRRGSGPALLWLWWRLAVVALIRPLAWEPPPYAEDAVLKSKKKKGKKGRNREDNVWAYGQRYR